MCRNTTSSELNRDTNDKTEDKMVDSFTLENGLMSLAETLGNANLVVWIWEIVWRLKKTEPLQNIPFLVQNFQHNIKII